MSYLGFEPRIFSFQVKIATIKPLEVKAKTLLSLIFVPCSTSGSVCNKNTHLIIIIELCFQIKHFVFFAALSTLYSLFACMFYCKICFFFARNVEYFPNISFKMRGKKQKENDCFATKSSCCFFSFNCILLFQLERIHDTLT